MNQEKAKIVERFGITCINQGGWRGIFDLVRLFDTPAQAQEYITLIKPQAKGCLPEKTIKTLRVDRLRCYAYPDGQFQAFEILSKGK